ncbi:hypothetical protein CBF86_07575 [Limosilactobacillus reuteri]|uniref:Flagellar assembly protein T C-terminal domain-containing protein n=1 Tax=Limosilactobacillus albertensis TaxID=2759752 RepID=A0A839HBW4_9LACO|nr:MULTISPECIES: FlgT C-terminal domain-containing protein [Limosilactobacillus]MBB1123522.1 hypothetical protein [Limosilactobacillus albertensis]MCD7122706.1 hypothetical protein [Limosilactobacillus albertensis]MCD7132422.1 hypothetical protein [Limosilactobacillus balticus]MQB80434.1 hypothetical protein [Limosilactobacillus reuteri]MQB86792.1 hypothetical protein [Limosilactobacillus reuteri]
MSKKMKVAKIISTKQIVVNAGSNAGLKEGDTLEIIDKFGTDPVTDPDTGENLGTLDIPKGTVIVSRVYPRMAIADAPIEHTSSYNSILQRTPALTAINALGLNETVQSDLNVDPDQITGGLPNSTDLEIHVGDEVIKRGEQE